MADQKQEAQQEPIKVEIVGPQPHVVGDNSGIDTTKEGGEYIVDGQKVDAHGEPLNKREREQKQEADAALARQSPTANPAVDSATPARESKKDSK